VQPHKALLYNSCYTAGLANDMWQLVKQSSNTGIFKQQFSWKPWRAWKFQQF